MLKEMIVEKDGRSLRPWTAFPIVVFLGGGFVLLLPWMLGFMDWYYHGVFEWFKN